MNYLSVHKLAVFSLVLGLFLLVWGRPGALAEPWQVEWDKTVEAANKEGRVNVYIDHSAGALIHAGVFEKAYPGIKVRAVAGRRSRTQITAERRARKYIPDVNIAGVTHNYPNLYKLKALDPIRPALILPEVVDESKWWKGKHRYADPERKYVFIFLGFPQLGSFAYNTNLVNSKEITSFWDFLNPKWKGQIESRDMRGPGPGRGGLRFMYNSPKIGPEFISRLYGEMDITLFRNIRQGTDWLARGKFAICYGCGGIDRARAQGLPLAKFGLMKEGAGLVAQYGTIALINRGPHPHAAKVFINWFLAREGQLALQKALANAEESVPNSLRIDIPKDDLDPLDQRHEGVEYMEMFSPERMDMRPALRVFLEALAKSGKK